MSERRANLEKDDVQADTIVESGKADMDGTRLSEEYPICCTGVVAAACTQGKRTQHGKPRGVIRDDQPDADEGQTGRAGASISLLANY